LDNAHNGLINGCVIDTEFRGIFVDQSDNVTIIDSELLTLRGVFLARELSGLTLSGCSAIIDEPYAFPLEVAFSYCDNCSILDNSFKSVYLDLYSCQNLMLENNEFIQGGILTSNIFSAAFSPGMITSAKSNTVNGKPLKLLVNQQNSVFDADDYGQFILVNCTDVSIVDGEMTDSISIQIHESRHCSVSNVEITGGASGITILNSNRSLVQDCITRGTMWPGIRFYTSPWTTIRNCEHWNTDIDGGIVAQLSPYSIIENCSAADPQGTAIWIASSDHTIVRHNTISSSYTGILASGWNITLQSNSILFSSSAGVSPPYSCGLKGVYLYNSTIVDNHIRSGDNRGILVLGNHSRFFDNIVLFNYNIGIELYEGSTRNILYNNTIGHNQGGNAVDNGFDNQWDDGISLGNLWSDYYGNRTTYPIPGVAGSVDRYPIADASPPVIEGSPDMTIQPNAGTISLNWTIIDFNPRDYIVYHNGEEYESGEIRVLAPIVYIYPYNLAEGQHNFTIVAYDMSGNSAHNTILVTVSWPTPTHWEPPSGLDQLVMIAMIAGGLIFAVGVAYVLMQSRGKET
ncbi:MAG: nitrous oxide reductase family maturation protein NosD, partial [Candidatus Hodarchaeota archaeon]